MDSKLEQKIMKDFPWFELYGNPVNCECGDGWFQLIYDLCKEINDNYFKTLQVLQVKEKYGGLRFYVSQQNDVIFQIINKYEKLSNTICEICGKSGELKHNGSYLKTLCEKCCNKLKYKISNRFIL